MRFAAILLPAAACAACAHGGADRASRAEAEQAVAARLGSEGICLPTGFSDDNAGPAGDEGIAMVAEAGTGFDARRRTRLDALAEAGLLTVRPASRGDGTPLRIYRLTPLGERHFHGAELGLGPPHNQPRFCYGSAVPLRLWQIERSDGGGCGPETLHVSVLFTYRDIPEWAEHPSLRTAFPEWVGRADADIVRYSRLAFERTSQGWTRPFPHDLFTCDRRQMPARRRGNPA
jgi:hypothetical protein